MSSFLFRQMRPGKLAAAAAVFAFASALSMQAAAQTAVSGQTPVAGALASPSQKQAANPPVEAPDSVTLTGVDAALDSVASRVDSRLSGVAGEPDLPNVDVSAIKPELEDMATRQRRIRKLQLQLQETQLSKELYETLYGESFTGSPFKGLGLGNQGPFKGLGLGNQGLPSSSGVAGGMPATTSVAREPDPLPLVSSIRGSDGTYFATILVPYIGEVTAKRGDVLPNGMKVTAVGAKSVTVSDKGHQRMLGFGTEVPRTRAPSALPVQFTPSFAPAQ